MATHSDLTDLQIQFIAQDYFNRLAPKVTSFVAETNEPTFERREQEMFAEERILEIQAQIDNGKYERDIEAAVADVVQGHGADLSSLSKDALQRLSNGIARALVEQQRLFVHKLYEPLLPKEPTDTLFMGPAAQPLAKPVGVPSIPPADAATSFGSTISAIVEAYLASKRQSWVPKTHVSRSRKLALFVEHVGANRRISEITPDDMRSFCLGLSRMRRAHHTGKDVSFLGRQTDDENARIEPKTVALHVDDVKALFQWAKKHGYCSDPPLAGLVVELPKKQKGEKARIPFSKTDIEKLFTSPAFTGCQSPRRRFHPGSAIIRDGHFWIPILAYYTGARLSELVQLHLGDAVLEGGIPYLDINEENLQVGSQNRKHVKSIAGIRKIPLHDDLITLGFTDFVEARRKDTRAIKSGRLFFEIPYGADGMPSTVFSKWFARAMEKSGLPDKRLVFHSFRHLIEDALQNALKPQYVINRILGHDDGHVSGEYGDGTALEVTKGAVDAMKLPVSLPALWAINPI